MSFPKKHENYGEVGRDVYMDGKSTYMHAKTADPLVYSNFVSKPFKVGGKVVSINVTLTAYAISLRTVPAIFRTVFCLPCGVCLPGFYMPRI